MQINRKLGFLITFLLTGILILSSCQAGSGPEITEDQPEIRVGYCQTMTPYIQELADAHTNLTTVLYENSAAVMQAIHDGEVQGGMIGRAAWPHEISENLRLTRLIDGFMLIAPSPGFILYENLQWVPIMAHENEIEAPKVLPEGTQITTYPDYDQLFSAWDGSAAVMLRWSQMSPNFSLLIPVDSQGNKIIDFRSPHFYYLSESESALNSLLETFSEG